MRPLDVTTPTKSATSICSQSLRVVVAFLMETAKWFSQITKGHEPQRGRIKLYLHQFVPEAPVQKSIQAKDWRRRRKEKNKTIHIWDKTERA